MLWLLFRRTTWGVLVRAATQDREMVAALGVNQKWLFTSVFALGVFLAALGGALALPREAANHTMDMQVITEALVVVVIGGLGSVPGTFLAAVIVSELNAFGILVFPRISIVLVFLVMAVVLVVRPWGLLGRAGGARAARERRGLFLRWRPFAARGRAVRRFSPWRPPRFCRSSRAIISSASRPKCSFSCSTRRACISRRRGRPRLLRPRRLFRPWLLWRGDRAETVRASAWRRRSSPASLLGLAGALAFGWFCVRLSGVYFAMLTLAFAQIAWSVAYQWTEVTGGDNGLIGVWPSAWAAAPSRFYWLTLALASGGVACCARSCSRRSAIPCARCATSTLRAETIGLERRRVQWIGFAIAGAFAALAGALYAFLKGSVFPDNISAFRCRSTGSSWSLLGGVGTVSGGVFGAAIYGRCRSG